MRYYYRQKETTTGELEEESPIETPSEAKQMEVQQDFAARIEAKLSYRSEIAQELDALLKTLQQFEAKE